MSASLRVIALFALVTFCITLVVAAPIPNKGFKQDIEASVNPWKTKCIEAAGGASDDCEDAALQAAASLLSTADVCAQQGAADNMIDISKKISNNSTDLITLVKVWRQQPRNFENDGFSVPYCQTSPRNPELAGLFQCQFEGTNKDIFAGNVKLGSAGTIPPSLTNPIDPPGSCPSHPEGAIQPGLHLVAADSNTTTPDSSNNNSTATSEITPPTTNTATSTISNSAASITPTTTTTITITVPASTPSITNTATSPSLTLTPSPSPSTTTTITVTVPAKTDTSSNPAAEPTSIPNTQPSTTRSSTTTITSTSITTVVSVDKALEDFGPFLNFSGSK